jgi:hypothetical protein
VVWKLGSSDEEGMSTILPIDEVPAGQEERKKPWILHILEVNTMNFCSFASYAVPREKEADGDEPKDELLIAVPNTLTSESVCYVIPFPPTTCCLKIKATKY